MRYFSKGIVMTFSIQRGCFCSRIYLRGRDHLGTGHTRLMWLIKIKAERRLRRYGLLFLLLSFTTCVWIALWFHHKSILPAVTAVAACWPCLIELRNAPPQTAPFVSALNIQKAADRLKPALFETEKKQPCVFTVRMNIGGCTRNPVSFLLLHRMFRGVSGRVWPPSAPNWLVPLHEHVPQRLKHQTQHLLGDFCFSLSFFSDASTAPCQVCVEDFEADLWCAVKAWKTGRERS